MRSGDIFDPDNIVIQLDNYREKYFLTRGDNAYPVASSSQYLQNFFINTGLIRHISGCLIDSQDIGWTMMADYEITLKGLWILFAIKEGKLKPNKVFDLMQIRIKNLQARNLY